MSCEDCATAYDAGRADGQRRIAALEAELAAERAARQEAERGRDWYRNRIDEAISELESRGLGGERVAPATGIRWLFGRLTKRAEAAEAELAAERAARQEAQAREIALRDALVPFAQIYLDCGEGVVVVAIAVSKVLAARDALSQPSPAVRPPKE